MKCRTMHAQALFSFSSIYLGAAHSKRQREICRPYKLRRKKKRRMAVNRKHSRHSLNPSTGQTSVSLFLSFMVWPVMDSKRMGGCFLSFFLPHGPPQIKDNKEIVDHELEERT